MLVRVCRYVISIECVVFDTFSFSGWLTMCCRIVGVAENYFPIFNPVSYHYSQILQLSILPNKR